MTAKPRHLIPVGIALLAIACARPDPGLRAAGVIDGPVVTVRTLGAGRLAEWTGAPGRAVRKGEVLGRLDDARVASGRDEIAAAEREIASSEDRGRGQIPALRARVDFARATAGRLERLKRDQAVSGGEMEKARVELATAEAALADSLKALEAIPIQRDKLAARRRALDAAAEDLVLRSPVDGIVLESRVRAGETLLAGAAAADILESDGLRVDVYLEERELARLKIGDRVSVAPDGGDGAPWPGTIAQFGATAEFSPRFTVSEKEREALLFKVRVRIEAPPGGPKVGLPVTVSFGGPPPGR
jgi:HlyD family secretion protein